MDSLPDGATALFEQGERYAMVVKEGVSLEEKDGIGKDGKHKGFEIMV